MTDLSDIDRRLDWAKKRHASLVRSVKLYGKKYPPRFAAKIAEDRMSWTIQTVIDKQPPLNEWGLWHAGIVHDLRSMLDNAVWTIAHAKESVVKARLLEFPIVTDGNKWTGATPRIAGLPEVYRSCIKSLQPFNRPKDDLIGSALRLVHILDIQNKHHVPVVAAVSSGTQEISNNYKIVYREDPDPSETKTVQIYPFEFRDGAILWHEEVPRPIDKIHAGSFKFSAFFVIEDERQDEYWLLGSLDHMIQGCIMAIDILRTCEQSSFSKG